MSATALSGNGIGLRPLFSYGARPFPPRHPAGVSTHAQGANRLARRIRPAVTPDRTGRRRRTPLDLTNHPIGWAVLVIFFVAYLLVMTEEFMHLRKSKPVMLAAGLIWALIAYVYVQHGRSPGGGSRRCATTFWNTPS